MKKPTIRTKMPVPDPRAVGGPNQHKPVAKRPPGVRHLPVTKPGDGRKKPT